MSIKEFYGGAIIIMIILFVIYVTLLAIFSNL